MTRKGIAAVLCGGVALLLAILLPPFYAKWSDEGLLGNIETNSAAPLSAPAAYTCSEDERMRLFARWYTGDTALLSSVTGEEMPPAAVQSVLGSLRRLQAAGAFPAAAALESLEPYGMMYGTIVDSADTRLAMQMWNGSFLLDGKYEIYLAADAASGDVYDYQLYGYAWREYTDAELAVFDVDLEEILKNFLDYYEVPRGAWGQLSTGEYYADAGGGLLYMASDGASLGEMEYLSIEPTSETTLAQRAGNSSAA